MLQVCSSPAKARVSAVVYNADLRCFVSFHSWGGLPEISQQRVDLSWQDQVTAGLSGVGLVAGCGRSYGDVGLAANGRVASCLGLNRVLAFDQDTGVLSCEAGLRLADILELALPRGWMLPVLPGTSQVTVAGAIANDVHGKNHHRMGAFGRHVKSLVLQRSDGSRLLCTPTENPEWFSATVAGLGLSGVILEASIQLVPVVGGWLDTENIKFSTLDEFFQLDRESAEDWEYTVAWIDCLSSSVRGHFSRANHNDCGDPLVPPAAMLDVPLALPVTPVNRFSLKAFNSLYFHRQGPRVRSRRETLYGWMFPLDRVGNWNRLYGRRGFRQYQCVVEPAAVAELLRIIREAGEGSFLAVLKMFGEQASPGLLSFPRRGASLALDFPWRDSTTVALFKRLDAVVASCGGAIYPAKDAHMSGADFRRAYPAWEVVEQHRDPQLKSLFWQRVMEDV
jgi:FAD/FMN-containing dehydrogenase